MKTVIRPLFCALALGLSPALADEGEAETWAKLQQGAGSLTEDLPDDQEAGLKLLLERLGAQREGFGKFLEAHPQSTNRWEAQMALMQIDNSLAMLEQREPDFAAQADALRTISSDADAPDHIRADAGLTLLQFASMDFDRQRTEASARALHDAIGAFLKTYPDDPRRPALQLTAAQALEAFDPATARNIYEEVAKDADPDIVKAAQGGLELMTLRDEPLDLSFTAVDGRKVDMKDLRGKVVLLDFWATWCPPCVEDAPALVAAYDKFHGRGFEIVGISLDTNKTALETFTEGHGMPWPQFFDGKGWDNELAQRFNIQAVPTMWLFDREGKLVDPAPHGRLDEAIESALARP